MSKKARTTDFEPDDFNLNEHTERGGDMLETSLQKTGVVRPIAVDKNGKVITGNATQQAAVNVGIEDAIIVKSDGTKMIVHQRTDLDLDDQGVVGEQTRFAAIMDNRVSEVNLKWDTDRLSKLRVGDEDAGIVPMEGLRQAWTDRELDHMGVASYKPAKETVDINEAEKYQQVWQVQPGDLWQIGRHRLVCADNGDGGHMAQLLDGAKVDALVSDPPYGIGNDGNYTRFVGSIWHNNTWPDIAGDDAPFDPTPWTEYPIVILWGANHYAQKLLPGTWLVWDKRHGGHEKLLSDGEIAWCNQGQGVYIFNHGWGGFFRDSEVGQTLHPTQKPVALFDWCLKWTKDSKIILDPYGGSGPVMAACELQGRTCLMAEIEPKYCSVVLQRMSDLGLEPHK